LYRPDAPWTGEHVCALLVKARRALSGRPLLVFGGTPGRASDVLAVPVGEPGAEPMTPGPFKVLHWLGRLPDPKKRQRAQQLREWVLRKAGAGEGRPSLRELVAAHPTWGTFATYNRRRKASCAWIARDLIRRRVPWFDLDDEGRVILGRMPDPINLD
jgi:hypothetical protein